MSTRLPLTFPFWVFKTISSANANDANRHILRNNFISLKIDKYGSIPHIFAMKVSKYIQWNRGSALYVCLFTCVDDPNLYSEYVLGWKIHPQCKVLQKCVLVICKNVLYYSNKYIKWLWSRWIVDNWWKQCTLRWLQ